MGGGGGDFAVDVAAGGLRHVVIDVRETPGVAVGAGRPT